MATKCIVLGKNEGGKPKLIKFTGFLEVNEVINAGAMACENWEFIELICTNYRGNGFDLMYAHHEDRNLGNLYLGHWNDGIVK